MTTARSARCRRAPLVVLAGVAGACATRTVPSPAQPPREEVVRFLEVNDIHILDQASTAYPAKVVEAMNRERADLVLVCGDLSTDGKEDELRKAKDVLDRLAAPYHVVMGNHDATADGGQEEVLFKSIFRQRETTYAFSSSDIHFVAIDPGSGTNFRENAVRPAVLARLRDLAAGIPAGATVVLFSHYPYGPGVKGRTPNAADVLGLFAGRKVLAAVGAHFHGNTEVRDGGVLFTTTATASSTRTNHDKTTAKGYRVFTVRGRTTITTEFREVPP